MAYIGNSFIKLQSNSTRRPAVASSDWVRSLVRIKDVGENASYLVHRSDLVAGQKDPILVRIRRITRQSQNQLMCRSSDADKYRMAGAGVMRGCPVQSPKNL